MRPLMEALCWVLATMSAGLQDAVFGLDPQRGWLRSTRDGGIETASISPPETLDEMTSEPLRASRPGASPGAGLIQEIISRPRIVVGVVMEKRGNHSPHRLLQGVLERMDRSKFRIVAFAHPVADYPPAAKAILHAVEEVLELPWHPFVHGIPDTLAAREKLAKTKARQRRVLLAPVEGAHVCVHTKLIAKNRGKEHAARACVCISGSPSQHSSSFTSFWGGNKNFSGHRNKSARPF